MTRLKTLTIQFDTQLVENEIQRFRGAIIKLLPQKEVLFHNHINDGYRYAYPLIQYKRLNNKAALFCIGEGVENIGVFFASNNFNVRIGNKRHCLQIEEVNAKLVDIACDTEQIYSYQLTNWLRLSGRLVGTNYFYYFCTMELFKQLASLMLPSQILDYFDVVKVEEGATQIEISLDETYPESYKADENIESKGFMEPTTITDFPIRDHKLLLHVRRRRWLNRKDGVSFCRPLN
ncbi:ISAon1 family transposase N-terminal region protein, partial [Hoylesella shahii]